jgi:RNA polymerase sigma-70 factor (ECF subfamily)
LLRRARVIVRDDTLAHDVLQETFVRLMRSDIDFTHVEFPLRFLYRTVHRVALDALRRRKVRASAPLEDAEPLAHPSVDSEERDYALRLLADLDEETAQIALYAFVEGMSQEEIAQELGYSRVTINKRLTALKARARAFDVANDPMGQPA